MSTPFTTPTTRNWQTLLNELTLAFSERRLAIIQSEYIPSAATNVQTAPYWNIFQDWLESNCMFFIDHINGPLNEDEDDFLYFTLATWRAAAGLNANGFRRSTDHGASFTYGHMISGDYVDSWIFEDLQNGFSALKWIKANPIYDATTLYHRESSYVTGASGELLASVQATAEAEWAVHGWVSGGTIISGYNTNATDWTYDPAFNRYTTKIVSHKFGFNATIANFCDRSADLYLKMTLPSALFVGHSRYFLAHPFQNGVSAVEDKLSLAKTMSITSSNPIIFSSIFNEDNVPPWGGLIGTYGMAYNTGGIVTKYDFTNSN